MDDPFLVRVLHGRADLAKQRQPGGDVESVGVAILGDRDALDQLHDEEGPAVGGRAGVQHAGNIRMLHERQGLALRLEAGQNAARVHAPLDQLQRHLAADRAKLLGHEDGAHPPLADLLAELVAVGDDRVDEVLAVVRIVFSAAVVRSGLKRVRGFRISAEWSIEGARRLVVGGEQVGEAVEQLGVVTGLGVQKGPAAGGVFALDGPQEQGLDALGIDGHARTSGTTCFLT